MDENKNLQKKNDELKRQYKA